MTNFLLDLWHDLRAKRLWPVALLLLAGLVAVPVVLSKKAEEPAVAPTPPAEANAGASEQDGPAALAEVKLEELGQGAGSSLSRFNDPSNPFAPPEKVLDRLRREEKGSGGRESAGGGSASSGGGDASGGTSLEGGSLGGGAGGNTGSGDTGTGDTGTGDTGTGDTGTGDTGGDTGDGDGGTTTTEYTFVADVTFRANDRRRKIKAMQKLDILPDRANPLLIFLGVTAKAGNAVFLVDSTLQAAGEGRCKPSRSQCAFLYLGPGSEHEFTNEEGDSYTLRVDEIRRVKLGDEKANTSNKDKKTAKAAVGQSAPARRFALPLLADLVSVSSGGGDHSNSDQDRR